jgi:hypothetical protein
MIGKLVPGDGQVKSYIQGPQTQTANRASTKTQVLKKIKNKV